MCQKCSDLDSKIEHYERIGFTIGDQLTVDRIKVLVADMRAERAGFHPVQEKA